MNVGQLKKLLLSLPDDVKLVVTAYDHSYREAHADVGTAIVTPDRHISEDLWVESHIPEELPGGKRIKVLIID